MLRELMESRKSKGGEGGVTNALLSTVRNNNTSIKAEQPDLHLDKMLPQDMSDWTDSKEFSQEKLLTRRVTGDKPALKLSLGRWG